MKYNLLFILLFFFSLSGFCQTDKDIKEKDIPEKSKKYIESNYPGADKKKYYKEIENDTVYYEISFRYKGDKYDLRFFTNGDLYEAENLLRFKELPSEIQQMIKSDLCTRYSYYTIKSAEKVNLQSKLLYEITLRGKKGKHSGYFELFYSCHGELVSEKEEILHSIPSNSGF